MEEDAFRVWGGEGERVNREGVARLRALLGPARIAMLTTADELGGLESRPMVVQRLDDDGDAWLVADETSSKVRAVRRDQSVNLAWLRPVRGRWISAAGRASVVNDRAQLRALWEPALRPWFPEGPDDPRLCLLRVRLDAAVGWDAPPGNLGQARRFAARLLGRAGLCEQGRETIALRTRQAGIGDTAGILGSAGGNMGVAAREPDDRGGPRPAGAAGGRAEGRAGKAPARGAAAASRRATGGGSPETKATSASAAPPEDRGPRGR